MKATLQSWIQFAEKHQYPIVGRFHTDDNITFHLTYMGQTVIKKFNNQGNNEWFVHFTIGKHHVCNLIFLDTRNDGVLTITV